MLLKTLQPRTTVLLLMILLAAAFRLVQSNPVFSILSNVTPIGAIALFGGCYFADRWKAFMIPLFVLWLSDVFLNRIYYFDHWVFYYSGFYWVYGSFALMVVIGHFIKKVSFVTVALGGIGAALAHWVVSDLGVWMGGTDFTTGLPFTKDFSGLMKCLYLALPFLRNMMIGNLVFCGVLFGGFELMQRRYPSLKLQEA